MSGGLHERDVELAVAVDVADDRVGAVGQRRAGLEGAVAVAFQHFALHQDVELAVAVEVAQGHVAVPPAVAGMLGRLERAVAVAPEHADRAVAVVDDRDVQLAVAVEVRRHNGLRV